MAKIQGVGKEALSEAPGSPGITRHTAFRGEGFLIVRSRVDPGTVSGWHHHGDYDVYGYMVSGDARDQRYCDPFQEMNGPPSPVPLPRCGG